MSDLRDWGRVNLAVGSSCSGSFACAFLVRSFISWREGKRAYVFGLLFVGFSYSGSGIYWNDDVCRRNCGQRVRFVCWKIEMGSLEINSCVQLLLLNPRLTCIEVLEINGLYEGCE